MHVLLLSPVELLPHISDVSWAQILAWGGGGGTCCPMLVNIARLEKLRQALCDLMTDLDHDHTFTHTRIHGGVEDTKFSTNKQHSLTHHASGGKFLIKLSLSLARSLFLTHSRHEGC